LGPFKSNTTNSWPSKRQKPPWFGPFLQRKRLWRWRVVVASQTWQPS
jgi:hypothetical protein